MKKRAKKAAFGFLELFFVGIAPAGFILYQYGNMGNTSEAVGFKVGIAGILLLVAVFLILKRTVIARKLNDLNQQSNNIIAAIKIETDEEKLANAERALMELKTLETISRAILPALLLCAGILCCRALEAELMKLSGALGFILISYAIGTAFGVLEARQIVIKNGGKHGEEREV